MLIKKTSLRARGGILPFNFIHQVGIIKLQQYGGVTVSTEKRSIDCMRRISVGLLKKLIKTINAERIDIADLYADEEQGLVKVA